MLSPKQAQTKLLKTFAADTKNFRILLKGAVDFPIKIDLKPPKTRSQVADSIIASRQFVEEWQEFESQNDHVCVEYLEYTYREHGKCRFPQYWVLNDEALYHALSEGFLHKTYKLKTLITDAANCFEQMSSLDANEIYRFLVDNIDVLKELDVENSILPDLKKLIPQLKHSMGRGHQLRTLPISGVDTKFIEKNQKLVESLLNLLHKGKVAEVGGLLAWLGCGEKPQGWLYVKPMCDNTRRSLADILEMRLSCQFLMGYELKAKNILVVENEQTCSILPDINDTIVVAGGGKNVAWLSASWLEDKNVFYWGDIDADGLLILSQARQNCPHIEPLMMDRNTVLKHQELMVDDGGRNLQVPLGLTSSERNLFVALKTGDFLGNRLEQERLDPEFVKRQVAVIS